MVNDQDCFVPFRAAVKSSKSEAVVELWVRPRLLRLGSFLSKRFRLSPHANFHLAWQDPNLPKGGSLPLASIYALPPFISAPT